MFKGRRVGTFTAGIVLVVFGLLFLARLYFPIISYRLILSLWPLVLIFLGIEILISCLINREEVMRYDGGAIVLIFLLSFFSICMATAEFILTNAHVIGTLRF